MVFQRFNRVARAWPGWLKISNPTAAALLATISLLQILYSCGSIYLLYQDLQIGFPPSLMHQVMVNLATFQFPQPILTLLLGASLVGCSVTRKPLPLTLVVLALLASFAGFYLADQGDCIHEMSHLLADECSSYPDTISWFLIAQIATSCLMLWRSLADRKMRSSALLSNS